MNQKQAKALRRIARTLAREDSNTALTYRSVLHRKRLVQVGWKELEQPQEKTTVVEKAKGILSSMWGWLKKMAGREDSAPVQENVPKSYVPDIREVTPETHVLTGGVKFYLRRMKRKLGLAMRRTLAREERTRRLAELALR